jgi:CDP-diacylglycerol--serine O-phosphatidyltransferase
MSDTSPQSPQVDAAGGDQRTRRWRRQRVRERAMKTMAFLPSLLTLCNMLCGFYAIIHVASVQWVPDPLGGFRPGPQHAGAFEHAAIAILIAMVFDMLDGRVARMMRQTSDFGGQLDSLADAITFGVAPGVVVAMMHSMASYGYAQPFYSKMAWVFGAAYACGAIIRLARFNVENTSHSEEAHRYFKGLPSPAAAGVIATLVLLHTYGESDRSNILGALKPILRDTVPNILPFAALAAGYLMVSTYRYVHAANVLLRGRKPFEYLTAAMFGGVVLALFPEPAAALVFCGFACSGPVLALWRWTHPEPAPAIVAAPVTTTVTTTTTPHGASTPTVAADVPQVR